MLNPFEMFGKIKEMQEAMKKTKERLDQITVEGEAGGGMVRVLANANRKILKINIDPAIINKEDPELMNDLIAAAVNQVLDKAEILGRDEISKVTKDHLPNIPGLDLSKLGLG